MHRKVPILISTKMCVKELFLNIFISLKFVFLFIFWVKTKFIVFIPLITSMVAIFSCVKVLLLWIVCSCPMLFFFLGFSLLICKNIQSIILTCGVSFVLQIFFPFCFSFNIVYIFNWAKVIFCILIAQFYEFSLHN